MSKTNGRSPRRLSRQETLSLMQAQDLMTLACGVSGEELAGLAWAALDLSADCADAYLLLADSASNRERKMEIYEVAMERARRVRERSDFEEIHERRWPDLWECPFMRARRKLAEVLLSLGRVPEAVEHLHAMIDADPRDREGVRFVLLTTLLEAGRDEEAWNLLGHDAIEFDAGCAKDYARALLSFRWDGSSEAAERDLSVAIEANPLAAAFLAGRLEAPEPPRYYSSGMAGEEEAAGVAFDQGAPWRQTAGAVEWLGLRLSAEFPDVSVETCGPLRPGVISTARSSVGVTSFGGPGVSRAS